MRVLTIGSDRTVLDPASRAGKRVRTYAQCFEASHIIVFSRASQGLSEVKDGSLEVYPTNSLSRLLYVTDAVRIGKKLPKPGVISVQDPFESGLVGLMLAKYFAVPLHVQIHTDLFSPAFRRSILNKVRMHIARRVLSYASGIRVVSERTKRDVLEHFNVDAPISVLPIFVDIERFKNAQAPVELTARFSQYKTACLVVSRLEAEKNVSLAVDAFARAYIPDSCLIILGEGSERRSLERLAKERGVQSSVFFEGDTDSAPYYQLADIVLVPSKYEGYGMVIVEALAAGVPVLSTDVGVAREVGAAVVAQQDFSIALQTWSTQGPRTGVLHSYPYQTEKEYIQRYCEDVIDTARTAKA